MRGWRIGRTTTGFVTVCRRLDDGHCAVFDAASCQFPSADFRSGGYATMRICAPRRLIQPWF